jgi:fatty-acyl-CoA synthase
VPAFVRVDAELPKLASMKVNKIRLRQDAWKVAPVYWRPGKGEPLRALDDAAREKLAHLLP